MPPTIDRLRAALQAHGERPALQESGRCLSYAELLVALEQHTTQLDQLGAQRVALQGDNGIDWVLWDLALLLSGRICVPVPGFFSLQQQQHLLQSAGIDTVIGAASAPPGDWVQRSPGTWQRSAASALAAVPPVPHGCAKITFTSGTTGQPKGVCLDAQTQLQVAHSLWQASLSCQVEHHLCVLPLATLLENIAGVYAPLLAGACIELRPMQALGLRGASGFDVQAFLACLQGSPAHSLILLPQLLLLMVSALEQGVPRPPKLRFIAVGGGRVGLCLLRRAEALGLPVFEGYGLSECASVVCLNTPEARRLGSVGRPLAHVQLRLAPDGEVLLRGASMLGYLGQTEAPGDWLGSGDLGHFEDGYLVLHGRKKNQFITAFGRNVNPEWVEAELTQHPLLAQAWLHGEARANNLALLTPRHADVPDAAIEAALADINLRLPDYAQVHQWLRTEAPFSAHNGLLTANGRLRREALLAHYQAAIAALDRATGEAPLIDAPWASAPPSPGHTRPADLPS